SKSITSVGTSMPVLTVLLGVMALTACSWQAGRQADSPTPPTLALPNAWHYAAQSPSVSEQLSASTPCVVSERTHDVQYCNDSWWQLFNDDRLNTFMVDLLAHNKELDTATLNLQKSLLAAKKDSQALTPSINTTAEARTGQEYRPKTDERTSSQNASLALNASWELDLWGRLTEQRLASQYEMQAVAADRQGVYMSLTAGAVRQYLQLALLNEQLITSKQTLDYLHNLHRMQSIRLRAGQVAPIDLISTRQAITQHQQAELTLITQKDELLTVLAVLFNLPTAEVANTWHDVRLPKTDLPAVAVGLPASTLANRPDMQMATWRLQSALLMPSIAKKSLYPNIVLTAGAGSSSSQLTEILKIPVLNWGLAINLPPLNPQEAKRTLQTAKINEQEAIISYQNSVYKALADVESKLAQFTHQQQNSWLALQNMQNSDTLLSANRIRYQAGVLSVKELLDSEESHRQATFTTLSSQLNQYLAWIALYQALGGEMEAEIGDELL
ncbi:MAG: TolC family protein, partial [Moraxella sp.]|nr:TolC family protein [Moraxella sp.]